MVGTAKVKAGRRSPRSAGVLCRGSHLDAGFVVAAVRSDQHRFLGTRVCAPCAMRRSLRPPPSIASAGPRSWTPQASWY